MKITLTFRIIVTTVILVCSLSTTVWSYSFDMKAYCRSVADAVGGSYQIEQGCLTNEKTAKSNLQRMHVEKRIENYCVGVANAVGGSYQIMYGCVQNEMRAKKEMGN